jgi:hypothetical protein
MRRAVKIAFGLFALLLAYIAGRVCLTLVPRIHRLIADGDPTMLFGRYRLHGWHGYLVPAVVGVFALGCCFCGVYLIMSKGKNAA